MQQFGAGGGGWRGCYCVLITQNSVHASLQADTAEEHTCVLVLVPVRCHGRKHGIHRRTTSQMSSETLSMKQTRTRRERMVRWSWMSSVITHSAGSLYSWKNLSFFTWSETKTQSPIKTPNNSVMSVKHLFSGDNLWERDWITSVTEVVTGPAALPDGML